MPSTAANIGSGLGAAGDLLGGVGNYLAGNARGAGLTAEASGYDAENQSFRSAAIMEAENAVYAKASGAIQDVQIQRKLYKSMSGTVSDLASSGLATSGSGIDVLRSSAEQGALTIGLNDVQTSINVNSYLAQQNAYEGEADMANAQAQSARAAASAAGTGGILGTIAGVLSAGAKVATMFA